MKWPNATRSDPPSTPRGTHIAVARWFNVRRVCRRLWIVPVAFLALLSLGLGLFVHHVYFDRTNLPDLEPFIRFELPTVGTVYDARGEVLFELAREYRRVVTYPQIPPVLRDSILSAEDKNFFSHSGVDYGAFPRVVWKNLARYARGTHGSARSSQPENGFAFCQGGSTITQQLVRGYFLRPMTTQEKDPKLVPEGFLSNVAVFLMGAPATKKLLRKMEEIRLSLWLEEELTRRFGSRRAAKEEILARYASIIYMGNGRYGFAAASEYYFGKPLSTYTAEDADKAAVLAGIVKCPRDCAPAAGNLERTKRRRNDILDQMVKNRILTLEEALLFRQRPVEPGVQFKVRTLGPAVIESLFSELKGLHQPRLSVEQLVKGAISVQSTASGEIQVISNEALETGLHQFEERHPESAGLIQGSVVVLGNDDARLLAVTGGRQFYRERSASFVDYNRATSSRRQPGSAMKPIVYLAAFGRGATLDHEIPDLPIAVPTGDGDLKWIRNYDNEFKGSISIRQSLAESRNASTTWIASRVGMREILRTAQELGIKTPLKPFLSSALGASEVRLLELANAYRGMASGIAAEPHVIHRIVDASGSVLFLSDGHARPLQTEASALQEIQEGLRGVVRLPDGTAHALAAGEFGIPVMGKTGTTSEFRDALFVGSTYGPEGITVAVRIGYDDDRTLGDKETGARAALPIFKEIMLKIYARKLAGPVPVFPEEMEERITEFIACAGDRAAPAPDEEMADLTPSAARPGSVMVSLEVGQVLPAALESPSAMNESSAIHRCANRGIPWSRNLPSTLPGRLPSPPTLLNALR